MRYVAVLVLAVLTLAGLTACAEETPTTTTLDAAGATVLDVRTPAEYAEGHLEGAVNLDVQDEAGFTAALEDLDPLATYIVYCRTGNRSATAIALMTERGFEDLTNAGGLQEAADATGLPIVTEY